MRRPRWRPTPSWPLIAASFGTRMSVSFSELGPDWIMFEGRRPGTLPCAVEFRPTWSETPAVTASTAAVAAPAWKARVAQAKLRRSGRATGRGSCASSAERIAAVNAPISSTYSAQAAQFPVWASRRARSSSESSPSSRSDAHSRERSHICGLSRNMSLEVTDGLVREELAELRTLKQAVPRIGQNAEDDEQRTERDEHEREVDRLPLLGSGGPARGAAAQEAHPRVALDACGATVPCEEAHDQDDRADAIEPERDRAADAGTEQEPERE